MLKYFPDTAESRITDVSHYEHILRTKNVSDGKWCLLRRIRNNKGVSPFRHILKQKKNKSHFAIFQRDRGPVNLKQSQIFIKKQKTEREETPEKQLPDFFLMEWDPTFKQ